MFSAINSMMLNLLAAVARKDYEDRRRRASQGIERARAAGKFRGRPEDAARNTRIAGLLRAGMSWTDVEQSLDVSRSTVAKVARRLRAGA